MEKLLWLFKRVHGEMSGNIKLVCVEEDGSFNRVQLMKNGNLCWEATRSELLLDYLYSKEVE